MPFSRPKILVVDDIRTNVEVLEGILTPQYDIYVALNGKKALDLVPRVRPDLILLDVMMPEMDGYETLRRIKAMPESEDLPVIFLTAKSDPESQRRGLQLGAVDYIAKPFLPELVILRVQNQLRFKKHRDSLNLQVIEKTKTLRQTLKIMLSSLAVLAEYRDNETGAHIRRTQFIVQRLAEALSQDSPYEDKFPTPEIIDFYATAAPLHDIGKVGIQDSILRKPGKLTPEEMEAMKEHTTLGYQVLKQAAADLMKTPDRGDGQKMIEIAANIAIAHHERFDGKGYPRGLAGKDIPLSGRVMAVADVYDAIVSPRVYKKALPHSVAMEEITKGSGGQFDPVVVRAFLSFADELPEIYKTYETMEELNV